MNTCTRDAHSLDIPTPLSLPRMDLPWMLPSPPPATATTVPPDNPTLAQPPRVARGVLRTGARFP